MPLTSDKFKLRIPQIITAAVRAAVPLGTVLTCPAPGRAATGAMTPPPPADASEWRLLQPGVHWGAAPGRDPHAPPRRLAWDIPADGGSTHWLRATLHVPDDWHDQSVLLALEWEGTGNASLEAIVYLDGAALAGLDEFHRSILLPAHTHSGEHELLLRCYLPFPQPFGGLRLLLRDETIFQLGHTMRTLLGVAETCRAGDLLGHELLAQLNTAYTMLDLREGWQSERFAQSARGALAHLRQWLDQHQPADHDLQPAIVATGHAHLDVAWLWPLWRTHQKAAHTVATALHLMERYPDYHFSMSQPQVFAFLQRDDPHLYARLKQRVAEGRFEPVGMLWLEVDCNLPSGESLVRQLMHGAHFLAEEFGIHNHIAWLPDVFGYSAALPQLLRGCGIQCFMTTKLSWSQFNRMPADTFRWRGIDGSEVLAHFVTATDQPVGHPSDPQEYTYVGTMTAAEVYGTWAHYRQQALNRELLYIYGWGDGGGGPTEEMLETARLLRDLPGFPQVRTGRVDRFFERLYERVWRHPDLPIWVGELYLEYHRGTYTSQGRIKQANRAAELLYREAEWLNAWAGTLGLPDQQDQLRVGWERLLLNQFHDILPGSSVAQVYIDSAIQYAEIQQIGQMVWQTASESLLAAAGSTVLTTGYGPPAVEAGALGIHVFNSLPWARRDVVRLELNGDAERPSLTDADGNALATQPVEETPGQRGLLAEICVPSYGYVRVACCAPRSEAWPVQPPSTLSISHSTLANNELRLELDANGEIAALYDRRYERDIIAPGTTGNQLVAYEDRPLNWDAWDIDIFYAEKPYPVRDILDWHVVEEGPLRAAVEITRRIGQSSIRQRICLWHNRRRIDFVTEVDWQERQMLLRALFPLNINATRATCEIQFGAVERPTHRNTSWDMARFEVCAHRWVDLSEGDYGVALLNDGKYGHSLHHSTLGLSLLKGAIHPHPDADRGRHRFTYSLFPHRGDWRAAQVVRRAYELNAPLRAVWTIDHEPPATAEVPSSFLTTPTDHIVVETVKCAEDGDGLIVRLYEVHNQRGPASLVFGQPVTRAIEVDLLERAVGPVAVEGHTVRFDVRPFEVKTLRVWL